MSNLYTPFVKPFIPFGDVPPKLSKLMEPKPSIEFQSTTVIPMDAAVIKREVVKRLRLAK